VKTEDREIPRLLPNVAGIESEVPATRSISHRQTSGASTPGALALPGLQGQ